MTSEGVYEVYAFWPLIYLRIFITTIPITLVKFQAKNIQGSDSGFASDTKKNLWILVPTKEFTGPITSEEGEEGLLGQEALRICLYIQVFNALFM